MKKKCKKSPPVQDLKKKIKKINLCWLFHTISFLSNLTCQRFQHRETQQRWGHVHTQRTVLCNSSTFLLTVADTHSVCALYVRMCAHSENTLCQKHKKGKKNPKKLWKLQHQTPERSLWVRSRASDEEQWRFWRRVRQECDAANKEKRMNGNKKREKRRILNLLSVTRPDCYWVRGAAGSPTRSEWAFLIHGPPPPYGGIIKSRQTH